MRCNDGIMPPRSRAFSRALHEAQGELRVAEDRTASHEAQAFSAAAASTQIIRMADAAPLRGHADFACLSDGGGLAVIGWYTDPERQVKGFALLRKEDGGLLKKDRYSAALLDPNGDPCAVARVPRADVAQALSVQEDNFGFVLVVRAVNPNDQLALALWDGRYVRLPLVLSGSPEEMKSMLHRCWAHSGAALLHLLENKLGKESALTQLLAGMTDDGKAQSTAIERPDLVEAYVDRAYALGDDGLLMYGWRIVPWDKPVSISVVDGSGRSVEVGHRFVDTLRKDVADAYRSRYPRMDAWCGFMCHATMPTGVGEARILRFDFGSAGRVDLKIPTGKRDIDGIELMREMLGMIPAVDQSRHILHRLFESGLGVALDTVNRSRPAFDGTVASCQFGAFNEAADISVIVPLYGRFDFLRHQLAQFADDVDFGRVDLIYVVDDPDIVSETIALAARYQALFGIPFRILSYGENRGFAGANNIGVRHAIGETVVLLNSDVIPQAPGWISTLTNALRTLPDAGIVAPLLLFGDGSVQHAGMYPRMDAALPGFLLNTHRGMGFVWSGDTQPFEAPMLTAACIAMRKQDYDEVGGFDEGYLIGDFEDSDLCLALRKRGRRLWMVPEARLWHLERQSQNLGNVVGQRQLITLFNGWRFQQKIRRGVLTDPRGVELAG